MQLIEATVKGYPRSVTTKYGDRVVMNCLTHDGDEITIWRNASDIEVLSRRDGERVKLAVDSKGKYHLMKSLSTGLTESNHSENGSGNENGNSSRAPEIRDYVGRLAKLYHHCYRAVVDEFSQDNLEPPQLKDVASCLFIQTIRKFDL